MRKGRTKYLPIPAFLIDALLLFNSYFTAAYFVFDGVFPNKTLYISVFVGLLLLWLLLSLYHKLYDLPQIIYLDRVLSKTIYVVTVFIVCSAALLFIVKGSAFSRLFFLVATLMFGFMLVCWHAMLMSLFKGYRAAGKSFKNVAVLGFDAKMEQLINNVLLKAENGYKLHSIFADAQLPTRFQPYHKGGAEDLIEVLQSKQVNEMFISLPLEQADLINKTISYCDNHLIRVHIIPNFSDYLSQNFTMNYMNNMALLCLRSEPLESLSSRMEKRVFDVVFSVGVFLCIGWWLFPIVAVLIKLNSKGPVFFSQLRSGKDGKPFKCYKFRSMTVNTMSDTLQATKNDSRVTAVGRILRKTSLDEVPQFYNVLLGNMSVVGPRPHMLAHTEAYSASVHKFMVRHFAKPGITGWAQTKGLRGEIKTVQDMTNRAEADIWYIENWSVLLDIKIIVLTIWQVFFKRDPKAF